MPLKKIIVANWKQNGSVAKLKLLATNIITLAKKRKIKNDIVILPPFVHLDMLSKHIKKSKLGKKLTIGAQNISPFDDGAYTGEISLKMCNDFNCRYFLVGHSERRNIFFEQDGLISLKVQKVIENNKKVILCVGESLLQRRKNIEKRVLSQQLKSGLQKLTPLMKRDKVDNIVIAYEPIWAIGTGKSASMKDIYNIHTHILKVLESIFPNVKNKPRILYGGSVNDKNSREILSINGVDGALVGGASLNAKKFIDICSSI